VFFLSFFIFGFSGPRLSVSAREPLYAKSVPRGKTLNSNKLRINGAQILLALPKTRAQVLRSSSCHGHLAPHFPVFQNA
jgi:hypothetical protein